MANTIKIKRGLKSSLPTLNGGELAYCTDTEELFVGTTSGNVLINKTGGVSNFNDLTDKPYSSLIGTISNPIDLDTFNTIPEGMLSVHYHVSGVYTSTSDPESFSQVGGMGVPLDILLLNGVDMIIQYCIAIGVAIYVRVYANAQWMLASSGDYITTDSAYMKDDYVPNSPQDLTTKQYVDTAVAGAGGISDGDKGDVTVSNSGANITIDNEAVTYAKMQKMTNSKAFLGANQTAMPDGTYAVEEITPANAKTILGLNNVTNDAQLKTSQLETTITNDDTKVPSSGAVVDYVGALEYLSPYYATMDVSYTPTNNGDLITKTYFENNIPTPSGNSVVEVTVTTANATATKIGTTTAGTYVPSYGDVLRVTFTLGCNVNTPTLNVDGSGAKNIKLGTNNVTTSYLGATSNIVVPMWYDGTSYQIYGSFLNTTSSDTLGYNSSTYTTGIVLGASITRYKILMEGMDGSFYPTFIGDLNTTSKTISTVSFKPGGLIVYYNTTTALSAGASVANNFFFQFTYGLSNANFLYSVNVDASWTAGVTLYFKGTIDSTGGFVLDQTTPITTTLPTTSDGFVYRPFGAKGTAATPAWNIIQNAIMYEFKDGKLVPYSVKGAVTNAGSPVAISNIWCGTQTEYDAITTPSATVLYFIKE